MIHISKDLPRRIHMCLQVPAEVAIRNAMLEVENLGGDVRLTEAVQMLDQAWRHVSAYVDDVLSHSR